MNTTTQNLLTALTATLLAPPFVIKMNDDRVATLQSVIASTLPIDRLNDKLVAGFKKAIAEKSAKLDDFNINLVHVGDSQKIEKTGSLQSDGELLPAHDVTLAISWTNDTLRLATYIVQSFKYAESDRVKQSDKLRSRHTNRELLAALQIIDGLATIDDVRAYGAGTGKAEKDYTSILQTMGLADFAPHLHKDFTSGVNYQHADDNSAITLHVGSLASVLPLLTKTSKKNAFICATAQVKYDVVVSSVLDDNFIPVIKLRFTASKA